MHFPVSQRKVWINALLFVLTVLTTFFVGLTWSLSYVHAEALSSDSLPALNLRAVLDFRVLALSALYALVLLTILVGHELGHYLTCRKYSLDATLPYFIPAPTLLGTFGAFIRIKSPITGMQQLFDVGAAGPVMSFLLSLPAVAVGLAFSKAVPALPAEGSLVFGEPLLFRILGAFLFKGVPDGYDIVLHPVGVAGWAGLLVTAINLFPIGQLDGGHIAHALFGKESGIISKIFIVGFLVLGVFYYMGWIVMALIVILIGMKRRPTYEKEPPLSRGRKTAAVLIVGIFLLSFVPDPIRGYDGLTWFKNLFGL